LHLARIWQSFHRHFCVVNQGFPSYRRSCLVVEVPAWFYPLMEYSDNLD
jgi:hypothetical protein